MLSPSIKISGPQRVIDSAASAILAFLGIGKMGEVGWVVRREDLNAEIAEVLLTSVAPTARIYLGGLSGFGILLEWIIEELSFMLIRGSPKFFLTRRPRNRICSIRFESAFCTDHLNAVEVAMYMPFVY